MVIYVADDDPRLEDYKSVLSNRNLVIGKRRTYAEVNNYCMCELYPDYPYYSEIGDDHVYHTDRWDEKLVNEIESHGGWGFACGNMGNSLPSGMVTSANVIKALGYYITPILKQAYVDNFHQELGEACGMLYRVNGVDIEHKHWIFGKAPPDENYAAVTNADNMRESLQLFNEWKDKYKQRDVEKILNAYRGVH